MALPYSNRYVKYLIIYYITYPSGIRGISLDQQVDSFDQQVDPYAISADQLELKEEIPDFSSNQLLKDWN